MDEIQEQSASIQKVSETKDSFESNTESQFPFQIKQDDYEDQLPPEQITKTKKIRWDLLQISEQNESILRKSIRMAKSILRKSIRMGQNVQRKSIFTVQKNPFLKQDPEQIDEQNDQVIRSRCKTMSPIQKKQNDNSQLDYQRMRQKSFPTVMPEDDYDSDDSDSSFDDEDSQNNDSDSQEDQQNTKEQQQIQVLTQKIAQLIKQTLSQQQLTLKKQSTLKYESTPSNSNQKSCVQFSSEKKQIKRKFSYQKTQDLLNLEDVDIKNQEHNIFIYSVQNKTSQFALELLKKKKNKTKLEKRFLIKILNCCSIFQKNKNLMQSECQSLKILDLFSYQFMPKNTIVFNQGNIQLIKKYNLTQFFYLIKLGEYGNTYYIVLSGQCMCMIPDPDYKSKEKFILEHLQKRKQYFLDNQYTKVDDLSLKEKQKYNLTRNNSFKDSSDSSQKKIEKDILSLLPECFPMLKLVHTFKSGESFGDIALITNDRRTATLVCKEDTHFLTLTKEGYEKIIGGYEARLLEETINFLRQFSYFKNIVRSRLLQILCWMKEQHFCKKSIIYKEGEQSNAVYFIRSGEIEISQATDFSNDQSSDQNKQQESNSSAAKESDKILELNSVKRKKLNRMNTKKISLAILGEDQYFGQDEVLDNVPNRLQTAQCISQTAHVYILPKQKFTDMIRLNHTSMEKIKKEEKMKFNWKQERLQLISETRQQNSKNLKYMQFNDNRDIFIDFSSPISSKSQSNQNSPSFGYQSLTSFNSDVNDSSVFNRFGKDDQIIESDEISTQQAKRLAYAKNKIKTFNKTSTKFTDSINCSQIYCDTDEPILNFLDQKNEQIQKDFEILSPVKPPKNAILSTKQSHKNQSSRVLLQNILSSPKSQNISNEILNENIFEKQKTNQFKFKRNQSNIIFENLNTSEQKQNTTYHFNTSFNSPKSLPQKYSFNPIFNRFQKPQSQQQKNIQNTSLNNFNNTSNNIQIPMQQINNQSFISSTSFQENKSPQNSSHLEYLKMIHQNLAAKQGVLEQLKQQTFQNNSTVQNKQIFGQTFSSGENINSFQMFVQEDTKIKQFNNMKQNTVFHTPQNRLNKPVSTPNTFTLRNLKSRKSQSKTNMSSEREVKLNLSNPQMLQKQINEQNAKDVPEKMSNTNDLSVIINQSQNQNESQRQVILPQLQNDDAFNQNNLLPIYHKPVTTLSQSPQKQKIIQTKVILQKNEQTKPQTDQTIINNKKEEQDLSIGASKLKSQKSTENIKISQQQIKTHVILKQEILNKQYDQTNLMSNKEDHAQKQKDQYIGFKYFLSSNTEDQTQNGNTNFDQLKLNPYLKETARNQPIINRGRSGKSLELAFKTTKYMSNSHSFTNSSIIQNIQSPKNDKIIQQADMTNKQQQKNKIFIDDINEKQNQTYSKESQNNIKNSIQENKYISINTSNNKQTQMKSTALQNDIQNFMEFGKIGKFLKLDKLFRNNQDKLLFTQLVESQQVKAQQKGTNRINKSQSSLIKHLLEKPPNEPQSNLDSHLIIQKFKKQNIFNSQIQNSS